MVTKILLIHVLNSLGYRGPVILGARIKRKIRDTMHLNKKIFYRGKIGICNSRSKYNLCCQFKIFLIGKYNLSGNSKECTPPPPACDLEETLTCQI